MSVSALCSALSVASAGRSELSLLSVETFAQSVLQSRSTRHDPRVEQWQTGALGGGRNGEGKEGVYPQRDFEPPQVSGYSPAS